MCMLCICACVCVCACGVCLCVVCACVCVCVLSKCLCTCVCVYTWRTYARECVLACALKSVSLQLSPQRGHYSLIPPNSIHVHLTWRGRDFLFKLGSLHPSLLISGSARPQYIRLRFNNKNNVVLIILFTNKYTQTGTVLHSSENGSGICFN